MIRNIIMYDWIVGEIVVLCVLSVPGSQQLIRTEQARQNIVPSAFLIAVFIGCMITALFWLLAVSKLTYSATMKFIWWLRGSK